MTPDQTPTYYVHGATPEEQERLSKLNVILNDGYFRQLQLQGGERILDLGCGLGQLSRMMARQIGKAGHLLGIERDPDQINAARKLAKEAGEEKLAEFRQGNALDLPLKESEWGSFDIVHTRFLLEHIPTPEKVIHQMKKALKPGGRLIISDDDHATFTPTPDPPGFQTLWNAYIRSYDRMGNDPFIGRRLVSLLHNAGVKNIKNTLLFFGGCAGQPIFPLVADNLIGIFDGAKELLLKEQLIDQISFDKGIEGLHHWSQQPDAALWYGVCWAEGVKGSTPPPSPDPGLR